MTSKRLLGELESLELSVPIDLRGLVRPNCTFPLELVESRSRKTFAFAVKAKEDFSSETGIMSDFVRDYNESAFVQHRVSLDE